MSVTLRQETEKEHGLMYVTQDDLKNLGCYEVCIARVSMLELNRYFFKAGSLPSKRVLKYDG